ncbi:J domain-containing protein [Phormidium sp. CCY1219]|uniref:J domain-containing protein n=1 Tax=Phormidium sp. CCY1219 TaxID=2886104 RepID=UPI002D1EABFD|nr:DnaJ domain-containing protein [Phormidium sp. CCY1219]MEB3830836.1 DnaJ domain-containing protein [Phormidium sp. CCY1219]
MDSVEDKFRAWEIEAELQQLKEQLKIPYSQRESRGSSSHSSPGASASVTDEKYRRFYQILELQPDASLGEVKQAYRRLAKQWHPDFFAHNPPLQRKVQAKFIEINEAYRVLCKLPR